MHESPRANEWPGAWLAVFAIAGGVRLAWIAARAIRTLRASRALVRAWMAHAEPLPAEPWGVRASKIDAGFPVVAAAGIFKPHVFVDRRVIETCSPAELAAVAAHERAHISSRDNLRRLVVAACAGHGSAITSAWRVAAERAADERASDSSRTAAELASALLRVARIAPAPTLPVAAISTIHDGGILEQRVRHLLHFAPSGVELPSRATPVLLGASAIVAGLMTATSLPKSLHAALEILVQRLP
jgi:Zn-dependent protease with chaperone function